MILCLVGMSGVGKSFQAEALSQRGFVHHDIDHAIAGRVPDLSPALPWERPVETVGRWMGMPWIPGREARERVYLTLEAELTEKALDAARKVPGDHVIDTTGSVIYLPEPLLKRLREETTVVYLRASDAQIEDLLARYLAEPKPVVWGEAWAAEPGESHRQALLRCYPELLRFRDVHYRALSAQEIAAEGLTAASLAATVLARANSRPPKAS